MGDMYDEHATLADMYEAGLITVDGTPVEYAKAATAAHQDDGFDTPDMFAVTTVNGLETPMVAAPDPLRPEAKRGRYTLPNPENGKSRSWQRVTNFVKMTDDTYHLELWKQRNVLKGVALLIQDGRLKLEDLARSDVKLDRDRLNNIASAAQDAAEAYKMADEGTALHKSTEIADFAGGDLNRVPEHHRVKVRMYLDALAAHGLTVVPGMIERVTVSLRYDCAGKFDRIFRLADGSYVIGDLKTGDDLELSLPSIAGQLKVYEDGVNTHGIFDGQRYDDSIKVRDDLAVVIHLPSTRDEVNVVPIDLSEGLRVNDGNLKVRHTRKIKARHVVLPTASLVRPNQDVVDQHWLEQLNAAWSHADLVAVAERARYFGQWNERLANAARSLSTELQSGVRS